MSPPAAKPPAPRERILAVATDLFYRQGFRATGINQIIEDSGVAKASFYDHFRSKDDLLVECIRETAHREIADIRREVGALPTPRDRFLGLFHILPPWLESSGFRGCPFQNIVAELPPGDERIRTIVRQYREEVRTYLRELTADLIQTDPSLASLDAERIVGTYQLLFEGAIASAVAYRQTWPVDCAIESISALLNPE